MTTLLRNIKELEIFLNAEIAQKQAHNQNRVGNQKERSYTLTRANRTQLQNLSSALETDLQSPAVFEEVKAELKSPELKYAPQTGTIYNMDFLMRRFNELVNSFQTRKGRAITFIENQKEKVQSAYEDLVEKLCEHFKVKQLSQVKVDNF